MNWNEIGTEVILTIIGFIISGLGALITHLINKYVKNEKLKSIMNSLDELVGNGVLAVYQTYVEALKKDGMFDKEKQEVALNKCLEIIKKNMSMELNRWLVENFKDVEDYLKSLIEAKIASLKNNAGK